MARGPIYQQDYRPQFSGHETFPLRYGWLKKAYDRVLETQQEPNNRSICWGDDAIAHFGVGKNMVASMRHWGIVAGVIEEPTATNDVKTTPLGDRLFGPKGLDRYLENPTSLWLIHWNLATEWKKKTTWYWAFNYYPAMTFEREKLLERLQALANDRNWPRAAHTTLKNDIACFIRTYASMPSSAKAGHDDALESPLTELGLIKPIGKRDGFRFVRGQKSTLGEGTFLYALMEFWAHFSSASTLSFEAIAYEPGSPGRVFLLDENDVADRLASIDDVSNGALRWSETAGLKQVVRSPEVTVKDTLSFLARDYNRTNRKEAA